MSIYSNAEYIEEAGDVVGYEMAIQHGKGAIVSARLYVYEGMPNEDGIPLSGQIAHGKLTLEGNREEHLIEQPSNKEIVETQHVIVSGTLDSNRFRGTIRIADLETPIQVRLKRVVHIWTCGGQPRAQPD